MGVEEIIVTPSEVFEYVHVKHDGRLCVLMTLHVHVKMMMTLHVYVESIVSIYL